MQSSLNVSSKNSYFNTYAWVYHQISWCGKLNSQKILKPLHPDLHLNMSEQNNEKHFQFAQPISIGH